MACRYVIEAKNLECAICFELFTEPKLLSCSHTFCKKCLQRLYDKNPPGYPYKFACPMCRQVTIVVNKDDISKLQTSILINSMVEDVKNAKRICTVCDPEAKSVVVQYCSHCDEYMCDPCAVAHQKHTNSAKHDVVNVGDFKRGDVNEKQAYWQLVNTFSLSHEDPQDAVSMCDGRVAIGYGHGEAIEIFNINGPMEAVLRGVQVECVSALSDGRCIIRDAGNNVTLYNDAWERLDVQFSSLAFIGGDWGCTCVDRDDNIYVGSWGKYKIVVFRPDGALLREIACDNKYNPLEICRMNHSERLVVRDRSFIRVIDDQGIVQHRVEVNSLETCLTVLKDDSILVGCRKGELLRIELYTADLKKIRTVLDYFQMTGVSALRKMVELSTGEIGVVSWDQFIVFRKI